VAPETLAIEGTGKRAVVIVGSQASVLILQIQASQGGIQDETSKR
jgi:hypothetical protein